MPFTHAADVGAHALHRDAVSEEARMASITELQVEQGRNTRSERGVRQRRVAGKRRGGLLLLGTAALLAMAGLAIQQRRVRGHRTVGQLIGKAAGELGRGFVAGTFGTFAITAAAAVDQLATEVARARREKREPDLDLGKAITSPWSFTAGVVSKVVGIKPTDAEHERRLSIMAHWGYGSTWGLSLAAMRALGVRRVPAIGALLAGQLGVEMIVMPAVDLFPPPTQWGSRAVVSSVYQHAIYALAAVTAFEWLGA
jgi:hypothetical protein